MHPTAPRGAPAIARRTPSRALRAAPTAAPADRRDPADPDREAALLAAHRAGDPEALGALLAGCRRRIWGVCWRMAGDAETAADLAQDVAVKVIQGLPGFDGRSAFGTWVVRVAMNVCLSHLRKDRLRRHAPLESERLGSPELPGPGGVERDEGAERLRQAFGVLEPDARAVLILRDVHDHEYGTIAEVLDLPVGTVKSRLFRARTALRAELERLDASDATNEPPDPRP